MKKPVDPRNYSEGISRNENASAEPLQNKALSIYFFKYQDAISAAFSRHYLEFNITFVNVNITLYWFYDRHLII